MDPVPPSWSILGSVLTHVIFKCGRINESLSGGPIPLQQHLEEAGEVGSHLTSVIGCESSIRPRLPEREGGLDQIVCGFVLGQRICPHQCQRMAGEEGLPSKATSWG